MAVRWKQVMTMLLRGVSQSGTARAARCGKRDVSRAARVIRECSVDSALLASLSDREVAERWFPVRPRERAEGYLHPDLDACVERKGAYRRLPLKLLWYEYRDSAGREGLKAHGYQAFRARVRRARGTVGARPRVWSTCRATRCPATGPATARIRPIRSLAGA